MLHFLALEGALDDGKLKFRPMVFPDSFIEGSRSSSGATRRASTQSIRRHGEQAGPRDGAGRLGFFVRISAVMLGLNNCSRASGGERGAVLAVS